MKDYKKLISMGTRVLDVLRDGKGYVLFGQATFPEMSGRRSSLVKFYESLGKYRRNDEQLRMISYFSILHRIPQVLRRLKPSLRVKKRGHRDLLS